MIGLKLVGALVGRKVKEKAIDAVLAPKAIVLRDDSSARTFEGLPTSASTLRGTLDTLRLSRRYFPEAQNHKLQTLRYTFGLDAGAAHSAAGDVRVLHHLTRVLVEKSGMSLAELFTDSKAPLFVHRAPFGKHKGKLMTDVPLDYLRWMKGLDNLDPDLAYTINKILETT